MIHNFQSLDQCTTQLLQYKATQSTESAQLDEKLHQADQLFRRSIFKANERIQRFKDTEIEANENYNVYLSLTNDLKNLQMRRSGQTLLAEQEIANFESVKAKLEQSAVDRERCIEFACNNYAHAKKTAELRARAAEAERSTEEARGLRRDQARIDAIQTRCILFIQTALKSAPQMQALRAKIDETAREATEQRVALNEATMARKNAEADTHSVNSAIELVSIALGEHRAAVSAMKMGEAALLEQKKVKTEALADAKASLLGAEQSATHILDKRYAYELQIASLQSSLGDVDRQLTSKKEANEKLQSKIIALRYEIELDYALKSKVSTNALDFDDQTCALFIHFCEGLEEHALAKFRRAQSHMVRYRQLADEDALNARKELLTDLRQRSAKAGAELFSFMERSRALLEEELLQCHAALLRTLNDEKRGRMDILADADAAFSDLRAESQRLLRSISEYSLRCLPKSPSLLKTKQRTPLRSLSRFPSQSPSRTSSATRRRLRRFLSPTLHSSNVVRELCFGRDTPAAFAADRMAEPPTAQIAKTSAFSTIDVTANEKVMRAAITGEKPGRKKGKKSRSDTKGVAEKEPKRKRQTKVDPMSEFDFFDDFI